MSSHAQLPSLECPWALLSAQALALVVVVVLALVWLWACRIDSSATGKAKVWALSDRPVRWCASDPYLSQNVCDEKRERQSPHLRVLNPPMVHSFTEFLDLTPNNLRNGTPESSME
jgi:hypothetical protein